MLGEYYKFHKDTPRMFMVPFSDIINRYLDQMRKVDYYKIAKIIAQENRANPNRPPKGIIGEIPSPLHTVDQGGNREKKNQEAFSRILLGLMEESAKKCSDEVSVTV
jgi:predicted CopG family antitoxin